MNVISDKFNLHSKFALITGAAGMLGIQHANALLELGASVVLTDIKKESLLNAQNKLKKYFSIDKILTKKMDVTDIDSIKSVSDELLNANIKVSILINNAAIDAKYTKEDQLINSSRLEKFTPEQWDIELNVGLKGSFLCSKIFGANMEKEGHGVILNIASDLSVIAPDQRLYEKRGVPEKEQVKKPITYSVIKFGLIGMTKYLSSYWAKNGIRVNALSPGGVFNNHEDCFVDKITSLIPMGRMASEDEYKSAIQFLCSDASSYMTGHNMVMDGGRSVI